MQPSAPALAWGLPFAGLLASMALLPIVAPRFWHRRMGTVTFIWSAALLVAQAAIGGIGVAAAAAWDAILVEYLPFVTLLLALYAAGGGVLLRGGPTGSAFGNTTILVAGMVLGALMGTTAASMVLIHPLLHANAHRRRKLHLVLFLIVLVANAAGALSPLGNPPLYVGLLLGVPFLWPARHLIAPLLMVTLPLLAAFYLIDRRLAVNEPPRPEPDRFQIRGWWNLVLIAVVAVVVVLQSIVQPGQIVVLGQAIGGEQLAGILIFIAVTLISVGITARSIRQANDFTWHPIAEVAMLFAGIFVTIAPVVEMLHAGPDGPLAPLLRLTSDGDGNPQPLAYFWLTGMLSAFLDNAPTYLVFFQLSNIHPELLGERDAVVLTAISAGAVFFGGLTYIGAAPNLMLRAIAAHRGVPMPGFFVFMLLASALLLPVLTVVGLVFFS